MTVSYEFCTRTKQEKLNQITGKNGNISQKHEVKRNRTFYSRSKGQPEGRVCCMNNSSFQLLKLSMHF
jgi:hypothetical protein